MDWIFWSWLSGYALLQLISSLSAHVGLHPRRRSLCGVGLFDLLVAGIVIGVCLMLGAGQGSSLVRRLSGLLLISLGLFVDYVCSRPHDLTLWPGLLFICLGLPYLISHSFGDCLVCSKPCWMPLLVSSGACCGEACYRQYLDGGGLATEPLRSSLGRALLLVQGIVAAGFLSVGAGMLAMWLNNSDFVRVETHWLAALSVWLEGLGLLLLALSIPLKWCLLLASARRYRRLITAGR